MRSSHLLIITNKILKIFFLLYLIYFYRIASTRYQPNRWSDRGDMASKCGKYATVST